MVLAGLGQDAVNFTRFTHVIKTVVGFSSEGVFLLLNIRILSETPGQSPRFLPLCWSRRLILSSHPLLPDQPPLTLPLGVLSPLVPLVNPATTLLPHHHHFLLPRNKETEAYFISVFTMGKQAVA